MNTCKILEKEKISEWQIYAVIICNPVYNYGIFTHGLVSTEFDSIDRGGAEVNTF